ncbi:MAG: aminotransferase class V-fold PLP-dependent enzyme [Ignavibacteriae bacterium]|nr:aminotransferase class V-fold PLP-dependent enzyme [Ignavibacteriota bacterium]
MKRKQFMQSVAGLITGAAFLPDLSQASLGELPGKPNPAMWPPVDPTDERFWQFVRQQFPLAPEKHYMNTGGLGASPYVVIEAVQGKMDELEKISETGHSEELWKAIKANIGRLLGCDADEIALTRNTTEGINIVANGLPLQRGDEMITSTHEHVANQVTWLALQRRKGIVIKTFVPSSESHQENIDRIEKLITKKTRLISIPHSTTTTGLVMPIKELSRIAKANKIWFFVDGAQTLGMFPFNLHDLGCDAWAASGHKWLMGPKETGVLYVRKDMLDIIQATNVGAYSDEVFDFEKGTFTFVPSAQRYEYGTVSIPLRVGLNAAFEFVDRIGIENMWKRDQALSARLFNGLREIPHVRVLSPANASLRGAMITFMHDEIPYQEIQTHLNKFNLRTRVVTEGGLAALRISTHIYNNFDEVEMIIEGVKTAKKS